VEETITKNFRLDILYSDFINGDKVDTFKGALATVYGTTPARITQTVYAVGASADTATTHRRRVLSSDPAVHSGKTIVEAEIKRWKAIQGPTNAAAVIAQLTGHGYAVVRLDDNYETPAPGSTPDPTPDSTGGSMWIILVCVGGGLLVLLVGAIVCIQHYKATQNSQEPPLENVQDTTTAETVFVPIMDQNHHSLYADPHE